MSDYESQLGLQQVEEEEEEEEAGMEGPKEGGDGQECHSPEASALIKQAHVMVPSGWTGCRCLCCWCSALLPGHSIIIHLAGSVV